jgi:DNA-binding response OmpR family regulator
MIPLAGLDETELSLKSHMRTRPLILVADDDELLQAVVEHKLVSAGYDVVNMGDGGSVLEHIERLSPDALVLDAMMPIMDGFEVLRRLKSEPKYEQIPVMMLTALRRDSDIVTALNLGAADYMPKPFNPEELIARLGRLAPLKRKTG